MIVMRIDRHTTQKDKQYRSDHRAEKNPYHDAKQNISGGHMPQT